MFKNYWKEIIVLLVIKSILLTGLWFFSFRNPPQLSDKTTFEHFVETTSF